MQIKLSDIVSNIENIKNLQEVKLPVKVSYRLKRLVNKLDPILTTFNEKKNDLIKEHGELDEETKNIQVKDPEKLKLYFAKLTDLLAVQEEVEFEKIKIDDLGDVKLEAKNIVDFIFE